MDHSCAQLKERSKPIIKLVSSHGELVIRNMKSEAWFINRYHMYHVSCRLKRISVPFKRFHQIYIETCLDRLISEPHLSPHGFNALKFLQFFQDVETKAFLESMLTFRCFEIGSTRK